jgi:putative phosphoribosyl transferase
MFSDRKEAGRQLARRLLKYREEEPVVLALPRGGVPVGFEIARALAAPLDVILVRKIGAPGQPELAVGAVVDGARPEAVVNEAIVAALAVSPEYIESETKRQLAEIERRRSAYTADRSRIDPAGKTAIVVDDGIATGATVRAALVAVRRARPGRLVLAIPVAPPDTVATLREEVDELVCLMQPSPFGAVGTYYADFQQVSDERVVRLLRLRAGAEPAERTADAAVT